MSEYRIQVGGDNKISINREDFSFSTSNALTMDQWHHVVETYDGTTERVYIDAVSGSAVAVALNTKSTGPLWIAGSPRFPGNFTLTGQMLDFRIYDGALSETDIATLHTDGPNPPVV